MSNLVRWAARLVTSTRCLSVACITARSTTAPMKVLGGQISRSTPSRYRRVSGSSRAPNAPHWSGVFQGLLIRLVRLRRNINDDDPPAHGQQTKCATQYRPDEHQGQRALQTQRTPPRTNRSHHYPGLGE